jgi:hypothetical protein
MTVHPQCFHDYAFGVVIKFTIESTIPKPVWAVGFALEQPLHIIMFAYSASGIVKQPKYKIKEINLKRFFLILILSIFIGSFVSSCSRPAGFPQKVVPFTLQLLNKGVPVQDALVALFADTGQGAESEVVKYTIITTTNSEGLGEFKTSAHTYSRTGVPPATYKATLVTPFVKAPSDILSKAKLEEKSEREVSAYRAKIRAELETMPGFIPFEWGNIKTTPIKITVPEEGGTVTIEVTNQKTFQQ